MHPPVQHERYLCPSCDKSWAHKELYDQHKCEYKCGGCGLKMNGDSLLFREHRLQCKIDCELCGRNFQTMVNLRRHMKMHEKKKCQLCDQLVEKHNHKCPALKCPKCNVQAMFKSKFNRHVDKCKGELHKCPKCRRIYKSAENLKIHSEQCGIFKCLQCNQDYPTKRELTEHKVQHGGKRKAFDRRVRKPQFYHCRYMDCNAEFKTRAELYRHKVDVHFDPDRLNKIACGANTPGLVLDGQS